MASMRMMIAALAVAAATVLPALGEDKRPTNELSQAELEARASLDEMKNKRDLDLYEVSFEPLALEHIEVTDRAGKGDTYHYLTFRLRNDITDDTKKIAAKATRYNEILQNIATQYESTKVENAVTLKVDGETVLDRSNMHSRTRSIAITVVASDENGSRIPTLIEAARANPGEEFNLPDPGTRSIGTVSSRVRDRVEETVGHKLLTVDEIQKIKLPPYDGAKVDPATGFAEGEVYGVILFHQLSQYGDSFTIEVRGLSNKLRVREPKIDRGQVPRYLDTHILRRVMVLHYARPGDEFHLDVEKFTLNRAGWEWVDTFQRVRHRSDTAYVRYFLDNVADDNDKPNQQIIDEFWPYYDKVRGRFKETVKNPDQQLPDQSFFEQGK